MFQKSSQIGINTTAPAATLDVSGKTDVRDTLTLFPKSTDNTVAISGTSFKIDSTGKVTFISGQTFPGTGTITGVTTASGSGLSGGGTTGTLSLKVPSAGITNAMLQNSKVTLNASTAGGLTVPGAMTLGNTYTIGLKTCAANQVLQYSGTSWGCKTLHRHWHGNQRRQRCRSYGRSDHDVGNSEHRERRRDQHHVATFLAHFESRHRIDGSRSHVAGQHLQPQYGHDEDSTS